MAQNCAMYLTRASTVHFVKYVGCFQDTVHQDLSHLYNNFMNKCLHFNHLSLLHHVSCIQKWLIWFYVVLLCLITWWWYWFRTFAVYWMLYAFIWVIPRRLKFICRRFGTLCLFHLHRQVGVCRILHAPTCLWRWNRQSVLKHRHINFRLRGITQKKAYNMMMVLCAWKRWWILSVRL